MIAELGHLFAFLALASAMAQGIVGLTGGGMAVMRLAVGTALFSLIAFLVLIYAFVTLDFSVELVSRHSHSLKPMMYRVAGAWGNHEGSMLLWCVIMASYGGIAALAMRADGLRDKALGVQGLLTAFSLLYLVLVSNPFLRIDPAPIDGQGLNPLLQDFGVIYHPPTLYLGYVGFSFVFSIAAAALLIGNVDRDWARRTRPWALAAWSFLGLGIIFGSFWSYYELGWGGWWFWDPVENASFIPWLVGGALVHSLIVTEKRGSMVGWTVFLAVLTFCLSIMGTFLVRSGVLTSVHTFAVDPKRGLVLLTGLAVAAGGAFTLYGLRVSKLKAGPEFDPISREGAMVLNNMFLSVAAAIVLFGTVMPLIGQALGVTLSIGEPWFHFSVVPIMAILFVFIPLAEAAPWRHADLKPIVRKLLPVLAVAIVLAVASFMVIAPSLWLVPGVLLGVWVAGGVGYDLWRRTAGGGFGRLMKLSLGVWGMSVAHIGLGIFIIGAAVETAARTEQTIVLAPGESAEVHGRTYRLDSVIGGEGPNYYADRATVSVTEKGETAQMTPEKRYYPIASMATTEVAIRKTLGGDVYVSLGEQVQERPGSWRMRVSHHPCIDWIYGGSGLICVGGFLAMAARWRRRVAAPASQPAAETRDPPADAAPAGAGA